ncbi:hypothetical protein [Azospirillum sp. sgz301742]
MSAAIATEAPQFEGRIDAVAGRRVYGWAWNRSAPDESLEIEVRFDGVETPLAIVTADQPREDLTGAGIGSHAFEAEVELPAGADPSRLVAFARPRSGGAGLALRQRSETERLLNEAVTPHLTRLGNELDALRAGVGRALRDLAARLPANDPGDATATREALAAVGSRLDAVSDAQHTLDERVAGLEVFLMRIDGTLWSLVEEGKKGTGGNADRPLRLVVAVLGGAVGVIAAMILGRLF